MESATYELPRVLITAPASGSGKTTVTCAILRALVQEGQRIAAFKCGPDYIDPMFHREIVGAQSAGNLDLFFTRAKKLRQMLAQGAQGVQMAIVEGAMGYYDGLGGVSERASAYEVAFETQTPAILVLDCKGMSVSAAAVVQGMTHYRPSIQPLQPNATIQGVILNRLSPALYPTVKGMIEKEAWNGFCAPKVLGFLPPLKDASLESRHLGLVPAGEVQQLEQKLDQLAQAARQFIDLEGLKQLAKTAPPLEFDLPKRPRRLTGDPKVAVAYDEAFCFYYQETLHLLEQMGAQLVYFSPIREEQLPPADALLLGGGFPELYAAQLAENCLMRQQIKTALEAGMPAIAECGGFLYLHERLKGMDGVAYPMVGAIAGEAFQTEKLQRFGYCTLTAKEDNLLGKAGAQLPAHEFHHWDSENCGASFVAEKPLRQTSWECVHGNERLYAGFPHLYLAARPQAAFSFLRAALAYRAKKDAFGCAL